MDKLNQSVLTGCIYAIHNIVTNKYYIGQTRLANPIIRWKDHFDSAFCKHENYHLYTSMRKYGIDKFTFQVLEDNIPIENLDDKEKEYIIKYDSYNNGYNNTIGGQDDAWHSKLTEKDVRRIISLIQDGELSFTSIAKEYQVNPSTISDINRGDTWHFSDISYPISNRDNKKRFSEDIIQEIYQRLRNGESATSMANDYGVSRVTINNINNGKIYVHSNETYPIYKPVNSSKHLEASQIKDIINLLLTTELSYTKIGEELNIGRKTVSNIDNGTGYAKILTQLGYTDFPIRKKA